MKFAVLPNWAAKFDAPNWFFTITAIGEQRFVTNAIIAKSANIIAIGNA